MRISIVIFLLFSISYTLYSQSEIAKYSAKASSRVDSILKNMTLEEKIGQLIMVTTVPSQGVANEKKMEKWIEDVHVGGVLFLKTSPNELASHVRQYQSVSKIPLFVALDGENGLSFRMDSVVEYPCAMGLGAVSNDSLLYQMGREVGQQCKMLGINLNFAPVADVNSNPENPIINYRSFGENPLRVAGKSWQYARGMQDEHILVTAKHFPGHGDTSYDSHLTLPSIKKSYEQLNELEFVPFRTSINGGINGIMSAHISLNDMIPATLSKKVMTGILRDSLHFDGLIFSDGMNMRGITMNYNEADAAVEAYKAGVDVIEFVLDPESVVHAVLEAIKKGELTEEDIVLKCRKVLTAKLWAGLFKKNVIVQPKLIAELNKGQYKLTSRFLFEKSITILQNLDSILPLQRLDTLKIAALAIGDSAETVFQQRLSDYLSMDSYSIGMNASEKEIAKVLNQLKGYNLVIAGVHGTRLAKSKNYNVTDLHKQVVSKLLNQNSTILAFFANPYSLKFFPKLDRAKSILVTYGENKLSQDYAAQLIFGAIGSNSTLPVSINEKFNEGTGIVIKSISRFKYTIPEEVGFDSKLLQSKIDSFANYGVGSRIFPGCQIIVAKEGKIVFRRSYGFQTYDSVWPVNDQSVYDWASITKIAGPLPLLMKMTEDSLIKLDKPFCNYWPDFKNTDKESITLREILAHQAGFKSWVPFNRGTKRDSAVYRNRMLRKRPSADYPVRAATNLYVNKNYKRNTFDEIAQIELDKNKRYFYSDIAFYLFPDLIKNVTGKDYEMALETDFLLPLGASSVHYNPYLFFEKDRIIPTEFDDSFRKQLVHGFVHDESAALLGGVSGNAGLFGSATDLAKIMQFYLQGGKYGDLSYLKPSIVSEFTRVQFPNNENRRGLGFDKPYLSNAKKELKDAYPAPAVSPQSFGHTGFTGTFVWADPVNKMILVFLSNRVYPSRTNNKLTALNFRPELQQTVYKCQKSFKYSAY